MTDSAVIAPINLLPPETLGEILSLVAPRRIMLAEQNQYPWDFALVCTFWRDVVFSTPQLWSNIILCLDPLERSKINIHKDALLATWQLCLQRSGNCPLTISIDALSTETMWFASPFLESLMDHAGQWEYMTFVFPLDILIPFLLDSNLQFPRLRDLSLRGRAHDMVVGADQPPPPLELFTQAPMLSRITFDDFLYSPARLDFHWARITALTLFMTTSGVQEVLSILEQTPNLSVFAFYDIRDFRSSSDQPLPQRRNAILVLPELRSLSWRTEMYNSLVFFNLTSAPQLKEIEFRINYSNWDVEIMRKFFRRSGCRIEKVVFNMTSFRRVTMDFLRLVGPDVQELMFHSLVLHPELISAFEFNEFRSPAEVFCPRMKKLVLFNVAVHRDWYPGLIKMIQSRFRRTPATGSDLSSGSINSVTPGWSKLETLEIFVFLGQQDIKLAMGDIDSWLESELSEEEMKSVMVKIRRRTACYEGFENSFGLIRREADAWRLEELVAS